MVKDLTRLGRKIENVIIIDNSPNSYYFQPENALPSLNWTKDKNDFELREMMPFLKRLADPSIRDVRKYLSKVIDITEGTKTPIFNKRKAH
jgi:TFIIF-interacting CTD phosphatase-like protein